MIPEEYKQVIAKSHPRLSLYEHTANVLQVLQDLEKWHLELFECYNEQFKANLSEILTQAIIWHDLGKAHRIWQEAIKKEIAGQPGLRNMHGFRHEFASIVHLPKKVQLSHEAKVAILAHHGRFRRDGKEWQFNKDFEKLYEEDILRYHTRDQASLDAWSHSKAPFSRQNNHNDALLKRLLITKKKLAIPRALLQLCDQHASAKESNAGFLHWAPTRYTEHPSLRPVQKLIKDHLDQPITLLRSPTGSGKTGAAMIWAQAQIDKNRADRVIIAMPTRFTTDALAASNTLHHLEKGVYHSTSFLTTDRNKNALAGYFEVPITITTVDQLLVSLAGASEKSQRSFAGLTSAAVIIDESDFYDEFIRRSIDILLKSLSLLDRPVLIMSATLPDITTKVYASLKNQTIVSTNDPFDNLPKYRFTKQISLDDSNQDFLEQVCRIAAQKPTILYANTVQTAKRIFRYAAAALPEMHKKGRILLHHSRFKERDKKIKEEKLVAIAGENAWKEAPPTGMEPFLIILTQIGELSLNVSCSHMFSELCPLDRLTQRLGRLNRFNSDIGTCTVFTQKKKNKLYLQPYTSDINLHYPLKQTQQWLSTVKEPLSKSELFNAVNCLYGNDYLQWLRNEKITARAADNEISYLNAIRRNLYLLPSIQQENADEDGQCDRWKARDIIPERLVWIGQPKKQYGTRMEWKIAQQANTLKLSAGDINQLTEKGLLSSSSVAIGDSREVIACLEAQFYSSQIGILT